MNKGQISNKCLALLKFRSMKKCTRILWDISFIIKNNTCLKAKVLSKLFCLGI